MDIFEQAKTRAEEAVPAPVDRPVTAAATAFGFGLLVVGIFAVLQWLGLPDWLAWVASSAAYGVIAYTDSLFAWRLHRRAYYNALEDLKRETKGPSIH